jgi:hypothetical protein
VLLFDDEPGVPAIVSGLAAAVRADPTLVPRMQDALVRVLAAKGIGECSISAPDAALGAIGASRPLVANGL